jgi:hypothetical protein
MIDSEQTSETAVAAGRETSQPNEPPTYSVSTWDHDTENWHARDRRVTKWQLRRWLRKLYAESWDHVSILVERNE